MAEIVGQNKLKTLIDNFTLSTMPKTLLLFGDYGCGKDTFIKIIAKKFGAEAIKIEPENLTNDLLVSYLQRTVATLYSIDLMSFTEKQQNQLLKFIEEPTKNVYIILTAVSEIGILPTILNRCTKIHFEPYTTDELSNFKDVIKNPNQYVFDICTTPGQLIGIDGSILLEIQTLCKLIISNVKRFSYADILAVVNKLNVKAKTDKDKKDKDTKNNGYENKYLSDEHNKYNVDLFFKILEYEAFNYYLATGTNFSFKSYLLINKAKQQLVLKTLNKEIFITNFLINYREELLKWN